MNHWTRLVAFALAMVSVIVGPEPTMAQPVTPTGVQVSYVEPTNPVHRTIFDRLKKRQVLEQYREFMSPLRLPRPLQVTLQGCNGTINAWYDGHGTITVCYEYIELVEKVAAKGDTPPGYRREDLVVGPFVQVILHETSHAVFNILDIPIFGREEDAADSLAEFIMLQFGANVAQRTLSGTALYYRALALQEKPAFEDFSDEHGTDAQRFFNALCIAYGSDPNGFNGFIQQKLLPKERQGRCAAEYAAAKKAFEKLILPHVDQELMKKVQQVEWLKADDGSGVLPASVPAAPGGPGGPSGSPAPVPGPGPRG
jgi:hypothetical protein